MTTRLSMNARLRALAGLQAGDSLFVVTDLGEEALRASARRISAALGCTHVFSFTAAPDGWVVTRKALTRRQQLAVVRAKIGA